MKTGPVEKIIGREIGGDSDKYAVVAMGLASLIGKMEGIETLDRGQQIGVLTIVGSMRVFDDSFDNVSGEDATSNGREILSFLDGKSDGSLLEPSLKRALEMAAENLNPEALDAFRDLIKAQIHSVSQKDKTIGVDSISAITKNKGGQTALMLALEVSPEMNSRKRDCYFELGYLMQLVDDFADKEIDQRDGIVTLAHSVVPEGMITNIRQQNSIVRKRFEKNYETHQLVDLFRYIDKLLARIGILK